MKTTFNDYVDKPEIGDYIIFGSKYPNIPKTELHRYLEDHIGKLFDKPDNGSIIIEFDELPKERSVRSGFYNGKTKNRYNSKIPLPTLLPTNPNKFYVYVGYNILHWSKNEEDMEIVINSKKYNI